LELGYPLPKEIYPYHPPGGFHRLGTYPIGLEKDHPSEFQGPVARGKEGLAGVSGEFRALAILLGEERVILSTQVLLYLAL
jgi:hypothetical protein